MLSEIIRKDHSEFISTKIHTIAYSLFVPVFFFVVGMEVDLKNIVMISLVVGLLLSKFISGYIGGKSVKLSNRDSLTFGSISITQLTTTLAVTFTASSLGIIDSVVTTSIILLSVISVIIGPLLMSFVVNYKR